jgi:beta-N-acetylhexosaminidase
MDITSFTNEQCAGQRLMVGFDGIEFNQDLEVLIGEIKIGGIILFTRNLRNPDQIKKLCLSIQQYALSCRQPPLFIAIDQEGGPVARLQEPFTRFPGNPAMKDRKDAETFARITATELKALAINMNMAPVLDVAFDVDKSIMAKRSFGSDPAWVTDMGTTVIEHLQHNGIISVAKHFPGIGRTILDSHLEMPLLDIDADTLQTTDVVPFAAAMDCGVAGMMLSHILYPRLDPEWPASRSAKIARDWLRDRMGYKGIILTDDLDMGAIKQHYDLETVVSQILSADIDMALICHKGPDIETAFEHILSLQNSSPEIKNSGKSAVARILNLKAKYLNGWGAFF